MHLRQLGIGILERTGVPQTNAGLQTELLLEAELREVPSHGPLRLKRIVERIGNGVIDKRVLVPGERGRAFRAERLRDGVPLANGVWAELQHLADRAAMQPSLST